MSGTARKRDTSELIIELLNCVRDAADYDASLNRLLEKLSEVIKADRFYVLEKKRRLDSRVFEWCAPGVAPRLKAVKAVSDDRLAAFARFFRHKGILYAETLDVMGKADPDAIRFFERFGVHSELAVPLWHGDQPVGCLGADNYTLPDDVDANHILETIAPFLATVISNHQMFEELEWAGTHDLLTELLNRRGVDAAMSAYLEDDPQRPFVLALVDVDDFKLTNDLYGHDAGDEALRTMARALRETFPAGTVLGRNGGDELLVMLRDDAVARADELIADFSTKDLTFEAGGKQISLSASIGYVGYPDQATSVSQVYKLADIAMYAVKLSGKGRALRYAPDMVLEHRSQLGFAPRDIAENVPGAIMVHVCGGPRNGEILYANKEMVKLLDCDDLDDFLEYSGATYRGIIHPDDMEQSHREVAAQIGDRRHGSQFSVDYRIVTKSGAVRDVAVNARVVDAGDIGNAYYVLVIDRAAHSALHAS